MEPLLLQLWGAGHGRGWGTDKQAVGLCRPAARTAFISSLLLVLVTWCWAGCRGQWSPRPLIAVVAAPPAGHHSALTKLDLDKARPGE